MASPYAPPSAALKSESSRSRVAHAWCAFASGVFGVPTLLVLAFLAFDVPLSGITHTFPEVLRPIAYFTAGATFAALVVLPFRNLKWYWAVALGPILSFFAMTCFVMGYEYFMDTFHDPEV